MKLFGSFFRDFLGLGQLWPFLRSQKLLIALSGLLIPIIGSAQTAIPIILRYAIDHGIMEKNLRYLMVSGLFFFSVVLIDYVLRAAQSLATATAVHRAIFNLRSATLRHVLSLSASFHDRNLSGALTTRLTSDVDNLSESLNQGVLNSIVDFASLAGCVIGMFILDWRLAAAALIFLPLIFFIVSWFSQAMKVALIEARKKSAVANGFAQECLSCLTTIRLLNAQQYVREKYRKLTYAFRDAQMQSVILDSSLFAILDGISFVALGVVLLLSVQHVGYFADLSVGVLVAFALYIQQIFEPLKQLSNKIALLQGAFASIERVFSLLNNKSMISGKEIVDLQQNASIAFKDVSFGYSVGSEILKRVSFDVPRGSTIALVGRTGSGKSTIVKILLRLYEGYSGSIRFGETELSTIDPGSLRRQMGVVPQDVVLFEGSIAFNIAVDRPDITRQMIERAARLVCAHDFIERLPNQYEFEVKEKGANLSHGQRQLIVFARAIARDPPLLIFDEATSSIDPDSERMIQSATREIFKNRTVLVIAHRLSTIRDCDQILVCCGGRIVERGTHDQLINLKGEYSRLHAIAQNADRAV